MRFQQQRAQLARQRLQLVALVVALSARLPWPRSAGRCHWRAGLTRRPEPRTTIQVASPPPHGAPRLHCLQDCASGLVHPPEAPRFPAPWASHTAVRQPQLPSHIPCAGCGTVLRGMSPRPGRSHGSAHRWGREKERPRSSPLRNDRRGRAQDLGPPRRRRLGEMSIRHVAQHSVSQRPIPSQCCR